MSYFGQFDHFLFFFFLIVNHTGMMEKEMATHSSILAWRIPWTEESDGLQSIGRSWTRLSSFHSLHILE